MTKDNKGVIGRKRKKNGFTQISNTMLEDERLSWKAKGLLSYMLSRPDNWKINKADLQRRATEGREAVQSALNELKEHGYLHIYRNIGENNVIEGWIWEYDDTPFTPEVRVSRTTEKQQENDENVSISRTTENPNDGKSVRRETRIYNNTDFNNTDFNKTKEKKNKPKRNMLNSSELEREFETLWKLYPRKEGKKKAFDSFKKARKDKKVPYETIENGLYRYLRHIESNGTDIQYIMHGSTWFHQEKWRDEYTSISPQKKMNSFFDYYMAEFGGEDFDIRGYSEVIDYGPTLIPDTN